MRFMIAAALARPTVVFAAGGDDTPPTKPVVSCKGAKVYDPSQGKCVDPQNSSLERDEIYLAVRQLAYMGRYSDAQTLLEYLPEDDTGRLTYLGFTHRKLGNADLAMTYYRKALELDPTNNLARSYMGQGLVVQGKVTDAIVQLKLIRANGGKGSWSETSLRNAIATGSTYSY